MWDIFRSIGVIDNLKQKGSMKYYEEKLHEYQQNEADIFIDMGLLNYEEDNYKDSLHNLKKAASIYSSLNQKESEAFVHDLLGDIYLSIRQIDYAIAEYKNAFKLYSEAKSKMKNELLEKLKEVDDLKEAIELANEKKVEIEEENIPKEEQNKVEDTSLQETIFINCYLNYEKISFKLEELMKIIRQKYGVKEPSKVEYESGYFQKTIIDAKKEGNKQKEVASLQVLSNYLMREDKPYSAMQHLKTAFKISHQNDDKKGEAFSLLLLGVVYYLLGKESNIYEVFKKSLDIFKEIGYKKGETIALDIINTLYNEDVCIDKSISQG